MSASYQESYRYASVCVMVPTIDPVTPEPLCLSVSPYKL